MRGVKPHPRAVLRIIGRGRMSQVGAHVVHPLGLPLSQALCAHLALPWFHGDALVHVSACCYHSESTSQHLPLRQAELMPARVCTHCPGEAVAAPSWWLPCSAGVGPGLSSFCDRAGLQHP